ncbi:M15 family metallopeptidase [Pseudonocardia acaciae]|uniref:M15 family metallopeptidase n=1 Tax=Pseudonocardia acaciae TaxID=551276 RepID=UPI0007E8C11A|nr:M15 family metallopeptidase [Pseudonocardia acaciae]
MITAIATVAAVLLLAGPALPPYTSEVAPVTQERLGPSWRAGCPVGADQLRLVRVDYVGFDGAAHRGELVVADAVAREVADIFGELYRDRFPIERMDTAEKFAADDDRSMAADNTSAFNCRPIEGTSRWSYHAYGRAVDINTLRNPYISKSGAVSPPAGAPYADRNRTDPGMIHADDATVRAFKRRGWSWGGDWTSPKDYQHFEKPPA